MGLSNNYEHAFEFLNHVFVLKTIIFHTNFGPWVYVLGDKLVLKLW